MFQPQLDSKTAPEHKVRRFATEPAHSVKETRVCHVAGFYTVSHF